MRTAATPGAKSESAIDPGPPATVSDPAVDDWEAVPGDADGLVEGLGLAVGLLLGLAIGSVVGHLPIVAAGGALAGTIVGAILASRDRRAATVYGKAGGRHHR